MLNQVLKSGLMLAFALSVGGPVSAASADHSAAWLMELGQARQAKQWISQQTQALKAQPESSRRLARELLAESLRHGPQPWPVGVRQALDALLTLQADPELKEVLSPSARPDLPLTQMVKNYAALQTAPSLNLLQGQLALCYRLANKTCQADMLWRLGQRAELPEEDRMASFQAGQKAASEAGHLVLDILNQIGRAEYADYSNEDDEEALGNQALARTRQHDLPQAEAIAHLMLAKYYWEDDDEREAAIEHLDEARKLWSDPIFQAQALLEMGRIQDDDGESALARVTWNQALAMLDSKGPVSLRIQLLQRLSSSHLQSRSGALAKAYLDELLKLLAPGSPEHLTARIQLMEALASQQPQASASLLAELRQELKNQTPVQSRQKTLDLARALSRMGQTSTAASLLEPLLTSPQLKTAEQASILLESASLVPEQSARWAMKLMSDEELVLREAAVKTLNLLRPTAMLPELRQMLRSSDFRIRNNAVQVLWHTAGRDVLPELAAMIGDENPRVRENVLEALLQGQYTLPFETLEKLLKESEPKVRQKAIGLLSFQPQGMNKLLSYATDAQSPLQVDALRALGSFELPEDIPPKLLPLLMSDSSELKQLMYQRFFSERYSVYWPELVKLIEQNTGKNALAISVLSGWKKPAAVRALRKLAESPDSRQQEAFINLFIQTSMLPEDARLLEPLRKEQVSQALQYKVMFALMALNDAAAWAKFETLFSQPARHQEFTRLAYLDYRSFFGMEILCPPPAAYTQAWLWLAQPDNQNLLLSYLAQANNPALIWNGKYCGSFAELPATTQQAIRQSLSEMMNSQVHMVREHAKRQLALWSPESPK